MRKLLLITVLALCTGVAQADNGMLYIGAGLTNDNLRDIAATNSNLNSTNWKVWAGVRPISVFAVEADYIDLGSQNVTEGISGILGSPPAGTSTTHLDYRAFAAYAVGYLPIPVPWVDVFAKAGVAHWTLSGSNTVNSYIVGTFSLSDSSSQFAWGAGGQVHMGNFGARLEYENFSIRGTNGANLVSLSVFLKLF
ncbi:MAG TPA: outer membrane beta-barrel protein [Steroidobacteraceae bacterium]|nr:outer membrane beta-barrel protein [Steroidobacteraceae bacterium]